MAIDEGEERTTTTTTTTTQCTSNVRTGSSSIVHQLLYGNSPIHTSPTARHDTTNDQHQDEHKHCHSHHKTDYLVGLSPEYWCHVPLNIVDVLKLHLIDGINYLCVNDNAREKDDNGRNSCSIDNTRNSKMMSDGRWDTIQYTPPRPLIPPPPPPRPVSKCLLVGCIVYVDRRRDGSMAYVLDDGTGLIDCIYWSPSQHSDDDNDDDIFQLPSLFNLTDEVGSTDNDRFPSTTHKRTRTGFVVGDLVRVFGKIDCLAMMSSSSSSPSSSSSSCAIATAGSCTQCANVIREIHASIVEHVEDNLNEEAYHWVRCCGSKDKRGGESTQNNATTTTTATVGLEPILEALGPEIQLQIQNKVNLPSSDDTIGYWRVFGTSCQCELQYKYQLLYCHCQATFEPSDPMYAFRDALLSKLLKMEDESTIDNSLLVTSTATATATSTTINEIESDQRKRGSKRRHLIFPYRLIKQDEQLRAIACEQVTNNATSLLKVGSSGSTHEHKKEVAIKQLLVGTFSALRRDGIVSLLNSTTDEYIFISRQGVLEPYIESLENEYSKGKNFINFEGGKRPKYLAKVPNERLFLVKRLLLQQSKQRR